MKELVCVAPDGSLEVWSTGRHAVYVRRSYRRGGLKMYGLWLRIEKLVRGEWVSFGKERLTPKNMGREILGEL